MKGLIDCQKAEVYYFDQLDNRQAVPDDIADHFESCQHCQDRIRSLKDQVKKADDSIGRKTELLSLQFNLLNQWVSCSHIKPFLALLAMTDQQTSAVTPVTAHIDRCPQCAQDLRAIRSLRFSNHQLEKAVTVLAGHTEVHLDENQDLMQLFRSIQVRSDSDVQTCVSMPLHREIAIEDEISLEIRQRQTVKLPFSSDIDPNARESFKTHRIKSSMAKVAAMAAVFMIAAYLLLQPPIVKGLDLQEVFGQINNVENVYVEMIDPDNSNPIQKIWISSSLQVLLSETNGEYTFWNLSEKTGQKRYTAGPINQIPYTGNVRKMMDIRGVLMPFKHISELPEKYDWIQVETVQGLKQKSVIVYDLIWKDGNANRVVERKWRACLRSDIKLPIMTEMWEKPPFQDEFIKTTITNFEYVNAEKIRDAVTSAGFQCPLQEVIK